MKKITLSMVMITIAIIVIAQTPQAFKYQAVARDNAGNVLANQNVSFQISILQGSAGGSSVFVETHTATTNDFGLVNLEINNGVLVSGDFSTISWGDDTYFLQIEMDETGGTNYQLMGTSQLLSVPYSLYSEATGDTTRWRKNNDDLYFTNGKVGIGAVLTTGAWAKLLVKGNFMIAAGNAIIKHTDATESGLNIYNTVSDWELVAASDNNRFDIRKWGGVPALSIIDNNAVGIGTESPDESALLEVNSNSKGFLPPRMTNVERDAISSPAAGLIIFNSEEQALQFYDGSYWKYFNPGSCIPQQPDSITGNINPCFNQTGVTYSMAAVSWASNYNWTVPAGAIIVSGQGGLSIIVDMGTQSGNVSVRAESGCGNSAYKYLPIFVGIPAQPGSIAGNVLVDTNSTGEIYSINAVNGTTSYTWTVPSDATIAGGQGTTSISVDFGIASGNVSVRAENICGNSIYTDLAVTVFACGDQYIDARNSQTYNTVSIGTQCWLGENLNVGIRINGTNSQTDNDTIEKYCYNDIEDNCNIYGGLYQWDEMMQYVETQDEGVQGICPDGWYLPTDNQWCGLLWSVNSGGVSCEAIGWIGTDAGGNLKETGTTHWIAPNTGATNSSGFTALPGGERDTIGSFSNLGYWGSCWSTKWGEWPDHRYYHGLFNNDQRVLHDFYPRDYGFSVRCLRD